MGVSKGVVFCGKGVVNGVVREKVILSNPGSFVPGKIEPILDPAYNPPFYRNQLLEETMVKLNMIDSQLYDIVDAYNKAEVQKAKKEHRKTELLPKVSAHVMRHTACTRMAECRMDMKVLQYIMGHAHFDVTMEVYNHLGDRARLENEIAKLDSMAVNF